MNTENFLKVLKQIIKEEVNTAVKSAVRKEFEILHESLNKASNRLTNEASTPNVATPKKFVPKKTNSITYSSNPLINDVLNETATSGFSSKDYNSILEDYSPAQQGHNDFDEWPSMKNMSNLNMSQMSRPSVIPTTDIDGRPVTEVPEELKSVFTRDYSSLMKAIDKKKGK